MLRKRRSRAPQLASEALVDFARFVVAFEHVRAVLISCLSTVDRKRVAATTPPMLGCMNAYGGEGPSVASNVRSRSGATIDELMNQALVAGLPSSARERFKSAIVECVFG